MTNEDVYIRLGKLIFRSPNTWICVGDLETYERIEKLFHKIIYEEEQPGAGMYMDKDLISQGIHNLSLFPGWFKFIWGDMKKIILQENI